MWRDLTQVISLFKELNSSICVIFSKQNSSFFPGMSRLRTIQGSFLEFLILFCPIPYFCTSAMQKKPSVLHVVFLLPVYGGVYTILVSFMSLFLSFIKKCKQFFGPERITRNRKLSSEVKEKHKHWCRKTCFLFEGISNVCFRFVKSLL